MKSLILALLLATTVSVPAQQLNQPRTIKLFNQNTGESLGTATISGGKMYVRDENGVHIYTTVRNPNGTTTSFDPDGNIIAPVKSPD
jgi:hypothetical protein